MGKLEDEVKRIMAGLTITPPLSGAGVANIEELNEDERFRLVLARINSVRNAVVRLAERIDQLG